MEINIIIECILIGILSALSCIISYNIIYKTHNKDKKKKYIIPNKNIIMMCFILGATIHYLIKKNNITDLYCKKICYGDECFMVCPI
jgi:hypothetical protein